MRRRAEGKKGGEKGGEGRLGSPFTPGAKLVSVLEETEEGHDHEGRHSGEEGTGSSDAETSVEEATE